MNATNELKHDQQVNDDLARRIRNSLVSKRPDFARLRVRVDGNTVYLSGRVPSFHIRQVAVAVAQHVAGVHQIVDGIDVQPPVVPTARWG